MIDDLSDDLEDRLRSLLPPIEPVASVEDLADKLRELEDTSDHDPEPEPEELPEDGKLILTYRRAVVRRNEQGLITEIVEANSRKFIERDVFGTVVAVTEVTETEEVEGETE